MIVREVEAHTGDWTFGKGRNDYRRGVEATTQSIRTRLRSFLGDCFFSINSGIDWFNLLGGKDINSIALAVSSTILNTRDVTGIASLSVDLNAEARVLTVQYTVNTIFGASSAVESIELDSLVVAA